MCALPWVILTSSAGLFRVLPPRLGPPPPTGSHRPLYVSLHLSQPHTSSPNTDDCDDRPINEGQSSMALPRRLEKAELSRENR
jgi:hypothetical protein